MHCTPCLVCGVCVGVCGCVGVGVGVWVPPVCTLELMSSGECGEANIYSYQVQLILVDIQTPC